MEPRPNLAKIAVIIPCFEAEATIAAVLRRMGPEVSRIYCVDDGSTDGTADAVLRCASKDSRVVLIQRDRNGGVGAATVDGYRRAIDEGHGILVKLDADLQMDPEFVPELAEEIARGEADYVKGNRFFTIESVKHMPLLRAVGNAGVSFFSKLSSGYWQLFDPANGFTAIHADVADSLPLDKLHRRYFFESDVLFRLYSVRARVVEVPMRSVYGTEKSHLSTIRSLITFPFLHLRNGIKRIAYTYYLRNFSAASLNLIVGTLFILGSTAFGIDAWIESYRTGVPATAGTVMLVALPFLVGVQLVLSFVAYDMSMVPSQPVHRSLKRIRELGDD